MYTLREGTSNQEETKGKSVLPATDRVASYARGGPVIRGKSENECYVEARSPRPV